MLFRFLFIILFIFFLVTDNNDIETIRMKITIHNIIIFWPFSFCKSLFQNLTPIYVIVVNWMTVNYQSF